MSHPLQTMTRDVSVGTRPAASGIRVLHVLAPAAFGGLEKVVEAISTLQRSAGHEVHVAAILDEGIDSHPLLRTLADRSVVTHTLPIAPRAYSEERRRMRVLCEEIGPHVVHTHGYRPDVLHTPTARSLGIPVVSTSHGFTGGGWKNRLYERLQRRAFRRCDAVIAVSRPMAAMLIASRVPKNVIHCIPNAWPGSVDFLERDEARARLGLDEDTFYVGFIGRLGHEKGADIFLSALAQTARDIHGVVIGDGRMRARLVAQAEALGIAQRVHWMGAVENAGSYMKALDGFALTSRTEGTPVVLLEAMAAGVPIVATRVGGVPGVVSNREAILVSPDSPAAIAAAIDELRVSREAALWRAGRAAARLESRFSASRWQRRYDQVYRTIGVAVPEPTHNGSTLDV